MLLLLLTGCKKNKNSAKDNDVPENESDINENVKEESDVTILENEGEIEIVIPEDMESDGF